MSVNRSTLDNSIWLAEQLHLKIFLVSSAITQNQKLDLLAQRFSLVHPLSDVCYPS